MSHEPPNWGNFVHVGANGSKRSWTQRYLFLSLHFLLLLWATVPSFIKVRTLRITIYIHFPFPISDHRFHFPPFVPSLLLSAFISSWYHFFFPLFFFPLYSPQLLSFYRSFVITISSACQVVEDCSYLVCYVIMFGKHAVNYAQLITTLIVTVSF